MVIRFRSLDDIRAAVGTPLPRGDWTPITQSRIDNFADVTEDHEWLHVDPERASAGPYGQTVAHGQLILSLLHVLGGNVYTLEMPGRLVYYGFDTVRFTDPVPSESRIRSRVTPKAVEPHSRGHRIMLHHEVEVDGRERPAAIVDSIFLLLPHAGAVASPR